MEPLKGERLLSFTLGNDKFFNHLKIGYELRNKKKDDQHYRADIKGGSKN
jgi:hypothetical protein